MAMLRGHITPIPLSPLKNSKMVYQVTKKAAMDLERHRQRAGINEQDGHGMVEGGQLVDSERLRPRSASK